MCISRHRLRNFYDEFTCMYYTSSHHCCLNLQILTAEKQQDLIVDSLEIVDGLPTLTLDNKQQFVDLYLKASFLSIKPYLDELMIGLNHYGVSMIYCDDYLC